MSRKILTALLTFVMVLLLGSTSHAKLPDSALTTLQIPDVWAQGHQGQSVSVAFIDNKLDLGHPVFDGAVVQGYCVITDNSPEVCPNGKKEMVGIGASSWSAGEDDHGNMVAGNIRAVAPKVNLIAIHAVGGSPALKKATDFLLANRERYNIVALSMSFTADLFPAAGPRSSWPGSGCESVASGVSSADREFAANLDQLRNVGVVPFAASGNVPTLGFNRFSFPSCLQSVVSVGALDRSGEIAYYVTMSTDVEFVAPDYALVATGGGSFKPGAGTSAATPLVAGSFALLMGAFPDANPEVVLRVMRETSAHVDDAVIKDVDVPQIRKAFEALAAIYGMPTSRPTPSPTPVRTMQTWLHWTSTDQSTLGENNLRARIEAASKKAKGQVGLVCTGIITKSTSAKLREVFLKRAANSCAYSRKLNPGLTTQFKTKASTSSKFEGSVLLQFYIED